MTVRIPRWFMVSVLGLLALAGVAAGAFLIGRSTGRASINQQAIRASAYNRGLAAGITQGSITGTAQGSAAGRAAGERIGYTNGYNAAVKKANGRIGALFNAGTNNAFAGYSGWDVGHYYIVQIGPGSAGAQYAMPSRLEMVPGHSYNLCSNSNGLCGN